MPVRREITFLPITLSSQSPLVLLSLAVRSPLQAKSQTLEERREQAGGRGGAAGSKRVGVEEQPACARRGTREARPLRVARARAGRSFARGRVRLRAVGGRDFAQELGAGRFGAGAGAVEAAGPRAGRPLAHARGGCRGQVRVGRLRLQHAGFLADSEKMADGRPAWLVDG